jgi:hypothetical protein
MVWDGERVGKDGECRKWYCEQQVTSQSRSIKRKKSRFHSLKLGKCSFRLGIALYKS